jgi:phosphatidylglycerophosphate synthase
MKNFYKEYVKNVTKINSTDTYLLKYLLRPFAQVIYWYLKDLNISGNAITLLNIFILAILTIALLAGFNSSFSFSIIFILSALLDTMDGTAARYQAIVNGIKHLNGSILDAVSGYLFNITFWMAVLVIMDVNYGDKTPLLMVYLTGILSILPRLMSKKLNEAVSLSSENNRSLFRKLDQELSFTGFLIPMFVCTLVTHTVPILVIFYLVFYSSQFFYVLIQIYNSHIEPEY